MGFVRFVVDERHPDSGVGAGLLSAAYRVAETHDLGAVDRSALADALAWLEANLKIPDRFNRSKSKGFYRRRAKGISWLRDSADSQIARLRQIQHILESNGIAVRVVTADRVGYIVYEDEAQVVAEPFSDTPGR